MSISIIKYLILPTDTGVTIGNKKKYIVFEVHTGNVMDSKYH